MAGPEGSRYLLHRLRVKQLAVGSIKCAPFPFFEQGSLQVSIGGKYVHRPLRVASRALR